MWHCSWHQNSSPLCVHDCFGIQAVGGGRGWGLRGSEHYQWPLQAQGELLAQPHTSVMLVTGPPWQSVCSSALRGPQEGPAQYIFSLFLDRITWFVSTKSIWSHSSSTVKHFANEFSIVIPNVQTRRLRLKQQIHLVQSQTMEGHWKLIPWDPPGSLFTEQPTWSKVIFMTFFLFFIFKQIKY